MDRCCYSCTDDIVPQEDLAVIYHIDNYKGNKRYCNICSNKGTQRGYCICNKCLKYTSISCKSCIHKKEWGTKQQCTLCSSFSKIISMKRWFCRPCYFNHGKTPFCKTCKARIVISSDYETCESCEVNYCKSCGFRVLSHRSDLTALFSVTIVISRKLIVSSR